MTRDEVLKLEAGPRLDALVAEHVFGQAGPFDACCSSGTGAHEGESVPKRYSSRIEYAWEVVEAIRHRKDADGYHRWYFQLRDQANVETPWVASFVYRGDDRSHKPHEARGYTAERAICLAALDAVLS